MWADFQAKVAEGGENLGLAFLEILEDYGFVDYSEFITEPKTIDPPSTGTGTGGGGGGKAVLMYDGPVFPFAKGGKIDYTGLAMVHGSKRAPEAVLTTDQTRMFMQLRDNLEANGTVGGVNIGNITIQTNELNNAQDFSKAGQALAAEFQKAITRRGIGINTKR